MLAWLIRARPRISPTNQGRRLVSISNTASRRHVTVRMWARK